MFNLSLQVPKIGRKFVKPDDIAFIDETVYAPHSQTKPPYRMKIDSLLPLLGDRVLLLCCFPGTASPRHTLSMFFGAYSGPSVLQSLAGVVRRYAAGI